jgi:uncharacterized membrane protein
MRPLALLPATALVLLWALALWLWPHLPEQIPLHFDGAGTPDRFGARTAVNWFLLPGIATLMVGLFAFALPPWIVALARRNASYLSVPRKEDFARLDPAARARAVGPVNAMLQVIAAELALLFGVILYGTERVASGAWPGLPTAMVFGSLGVLLATALLWIPFLHRAVERELARS